MPAGRLSMASVLQLPIRRAMSGAASGILADRRERTYQATQFRQSVCECRRGHARVVPRTAVGPGHS